MTNNTRAALLAAIVTISASAFALVAASTSGADARPDTAVTTDATGSEPQPETATTGTGGAQPAAGVDIVIDKFAFDPADTMVASGNAITWTNNEAVTHNVFSSDEVFASPDLAQGDTYTVTLSEPVTVDYYCDIHQYMRGTITVTP